MLLLTEVLLSWDDFNLTHHSTDEEMEAKRRVKEGFQPNSVSLELVRQHFHGYAFKVSRKREVYFRVFILLFNRKEPWVVPGQNFIRLRGWVWCKSYESIFRKRLLLLFFTRQKTICLSIVPTFLSKLLASRGLHKLLVSHSVFDFVLSFELVEQFVVNCKFNVDILLIRNELWGGVQPQISVVVVLLESGWVVINNQVLESMWEIRGTDPNATKCSRSRLLFRFLVKVNRGLGYL